MYLLLQLRLEIQQALTTITLLRTLVGGYMRFLNGQLRLRGELREESLISTGRQGKKRQQSND